MPGPFVIVRDARGSLVHVRKADGECVGCIEVGLFEIVRSLILADPGVGGSGAPGLVAGLSHAADAQPIVARSNLTRKWG